MDLMRFLLLVEAGFMQHIAVFLTLLAAATGVDTRNEIAGVSAWLLLTLKNVVVDASAGVSVAYIEDVEKWVNIFV